MSEPTPKPDHLWKPGQSGNPKGRPPKGKVVSEALREILDAENVEISYVITDNGKSKKFSRKIQTQGNKNMAFLVAARWLNEALNGDVSAIKELANRVDGKPEQPILPSEEGGFKVRITYENLDEEPDNKNE